jgi:hypothetical protein
VGERDDARHQVEQKRERMSQIAHEVSRRMTPGYAKERAREMARERMSTARDRAVESSWFGPLLGAGIGALVAKTLQSRAQERRRDRDRFGYYGELEGRGYGRARGGYYAAGRDEYDVYGGEERMPGETLGAGDDTGAKLREKAAEVKERARSTAEQMKGRIQETTSSVRERLPGREQIQESTHEDTGLWALGAMALGALFGLALPEMQREREMLEPARRKARELGQQARDKALEKGSEAMAKATEQARSLGAEQRPQGQSGSTSTGAQPSADSPEALH